MFDIGFWELVILFGLGLVILGPERLPRVAMQLGNWAGQARRMARTLTTQIRDELDIDVHKPFNQGSQSKTTETSNYQRPGVDDLKPKASTDKDDVKAPRDSGSQQTTHTDSDAGESADEST
jgi:sec-independent protein translocase protein TatB